MQGSGFNLETVHRVTDAFRVVRPRSGFTLIEVALVIFIMSLLLAGVVLPLRTQLEIRMLDETQRLLEDAKEALLGYAAMYGHFPCPADGVSNGWEAATTKHDAEFEVTGERVCGVSTNGAYIGFLPAAELGITTVDAQGYAIDGWGLPANRIRYAVSDVSVDLIVDALVAEAGIQSAGMAALQDANYLHVCNSATGVVAGLNCGPAGNVITTKAAVVVWSVGANGGSATSGVGDEAENPNPNGGSLDRIFVSRPRSPGAATEFDDLVTWIPLPLLINRLVAVGHLP